MKMNRRSFLFGTLASAALVGASAAPAMGLSTEMRVTPAQALRRLERGNARTVNGNPIRKNYSPLAGTPAQGQSPFAAVVACADSRTDPDTIFDMASGNLFVVRNAGNSIDPVGLGSLEFAASALGVSLIVVLGHTACGAVVATESTIETGDEPAPFISNVVDAIKPAIENLPAGHSLNDAIATNANYQAQQIQNLSPTIAEMTAAGTLGIVTGIYGLASQRVTWLP